MSTVGIIANPASGKDLRRIKSRGLTVTNTVKENTVSRMLLAMDALGVEQALIMPDRSNLARRVLEETAGELRHLRVFPLKMPYVLGTQDDSIRAAGILSDLGVDLLIVLGGDGTSRVVSKRSADVPMLPVSTGTNNVFSEMIEGTVAGMAAAALATGVVRRDEICRRAPRLDLVDDHGEYVDHALVDLAVIRALDVAARAVWEPQSIGELYLTQARVDSIGMSAIGAQVQPLAPFAGHACRMILGEGDQRITAPIAPGLMCELQLADYRQFTSGQDQAIDLTPGVVALDGEREVFLPEGSRHAVRYNVAGPWVVNVGKALQLASRRGYLRSTAKRDAIINSGVSNV